MVLKLYNTRTRKKEEFRPLDPYYVKMYVCGPTVYDYAHIGNARPVIVFDVLYRLLKHLYEPEGAKVAYIRNITDVDDKINARAAEEGIPIRELTERTLKQFHQNVAALGCLPPDVEPRATEHIAQMKGMIETLVEKGCAYVAEDHVLFSVASMPDYGKLSRRSLDEMQAGARVEIAPYKRDPMDFVLWKPSKEGEPSWPSPCGIKTEGRPGWHIECSAMSKVYLGETFDIHGGGIDLVFPHHENEVAQSRCAHGTEIMANVWMHNGFLQVEGQKMSKSLGNFYTINELLASNKFGGRSWEGWVLRYAMLQTHYTEPLDWTLSLLNQCFEELKLWSVALWDRIGTFQFIAERENGKSIEPTSSLISALEDDLNTPAAVATLRDSYQRARIGDEKAAYDLMRDCEFLGILQADRLMALNNNYLRIGNRMLPPLLRTDLDELRVAAANDLTEKRDALIAHLSKQNVRVEISQSGSISYEARDGFDPRELIEARNLARKAKNWAEADRIRDELAAQGILLKDAKDPETGEIVTTWEIAR